MFLTPDVKLYSEALLYFVYAVLGIYGWYSWREKRNVKKTIVKWPLRLHFLAISVGGLMWFLLGRFMISNTEAELPWADAFSTSFSFVATWLEAKKVLSGWVYWIGLNFFSVWLYLERDLESMAMMMIVLGALSITGLVRWNKRYKIQQDLSL